MTTRIPPDVLSEVRGAARSRPHPVRSAIIGVLAGASVGVVASLLIKSDQWGLLALFLLGAVLTLGIAYAASMSDAAIRRACGRSFRREMDRREWCAYCHEKHLYLDCPRRVRGTR